VGLGYAIVSSNLRSVRAKIATAVNVEEFEECRREKLSQDMDLDEASVEDQVFALLPRSMGSAQPRQEPNDGGVVPSRGSWL
jgi:hypothetical protein